jgi:exonuclease SbcD
MRILHTSDWHLGARLCDRDRIDEHKEFLNWLIELLKEKSIDILLIAGDVFDSTNPPNSAEQLYYDFLCSVRETNCQAVLVIGGNHDSVSKLNSPKELLSFMSVYVNGGINDSPEKDIVCINDQNGKQLAIVCAIPFLRERDIHTPAAGESWQDREKAVVQGISDYYKRSYSEAVDQQLDRNTPIIAMGHLFAAGSINGLGQRDLYVGNLGSVSSDIFPEDLSYTALGHIHRSQKVAGRENIRYSGSPIHMDFGEKGEKEVIVVTFDQSVINSIEPVTIPRFRKLIRFKGSYNDICDQLETFKAPDNPFWADAEVSGGEFTGDINKILNDKAEKKGFEFLRIKVLSVDGEKIISSENTIEIHDLTVEEVFYKRCEKAGLSSAEIDELMPLHKEILIAVQSREGAGNED